MEFHQGGVKAEGAVGSGEPEESMAIRIMCINKDNGRHENPYVAITDLGWVEDGTGRSGRIGRERLYHWIRDEGGLAYVEVGMARAIVVPAVSPHGTKYVKTEADSTVRDNLLRLQECG